MDLVKQLKKEALPVATEIYGLLFQGVCVDYHLYDYLGQVYMQVASLGRCKAMGQYFTPMHICEAMARMSLGDVKAQIAKAKQENRLASL
jgi:type I restriction-modification system DNA methylase subunit